MADETKTEVTNSLASLINTNTSTQPVSAPIVPTTPVVTPTTPVVTPTAPTLVVTQQTGTPTVVPTTPAKNKTMWIAAGITALVLILAFFLYNKKK